jgi:hypothetical protein
VSTQAEQDDRTPFPSDVEEEAESTAPAPSTKREPSGERRPRRRRKAPNSGDLFFLVAVFTIILLLVLVGLRDLTGLLYSREAGIVLIVVVIQYLVLKSMDRTRVYQMENQRLRDLRRADRLLLRRARDVIEDRLADSTTPNPDMPEDQVRWRTRAEEVVKEIASSI